ncbi:hypothetical protein [[Phormidium ambiguum] IAM M-71]|nr:hypothetical protein [Phormidium ambiguum]
MYTPLEQGTWTYHLLAVIQVDIWLAFLLQLSHPVAKTQAAYGMSLE